MGIYLFFNPDLIILDCFRDMAYPAKLVRLIRSQLPQIGLIATSCNLDISRKSVKMGFDSYLSKPFDIDQLIALVTCYSRKGISYHDDC